MMKKFLAVVLLCLPSFGQAVYSGAGSSSGSAIFSVVSSGAPLSYNARTDNCVMGAETGCVAGASTGQPGSALVFRNGDSDPLPFKRLDDPSSPALANTCFTDPDFGAYECFVTDNQFNPSNHGATLGFGAMGAWDAWNQDSTMLTVVSNGGNFFLVDVIPARFRAHACSPAIPCFIKSQIKSGGTSNSTTLDNSGNVAWSNLPADGPLVMYERSPTQINKVTISRPVDGAGIPTGLDTITRTLLVDFTSDTPTPCKVLPTDYRNTWVSAGLLSAGLGGGGSYQTILQLPGTSAGSGNTINITADSEGNTDVFIMPVNNLIGGAGGSTFMFQASAGTTSGTEPNWAVSCPTKGSTCLDGTVTWTNMGKINGQGPGFDIVGWDPVGGCYRQNTRLGKVYRGTGNPDPAGYLMTDDWLTCDRQANDPIPGHAPRPCRMKDVFGMHASVQEKNPLYISVGGTMGGGSNTSFPGVGSCVDSGMKLNPSTGSGKWSTLTTYAYHDLVFGSDANWYIKISAGSGTTGDPTTDATNWQNDNNLCYGYVWIKHSLIEHPLIGISAPTGVNGGGFSTDAHNISGYLYTYRGGSYFQHLFAKPVCDDATAPCFYEGAANPGAKMDTSGQCNDAHPSYQNVGALDKELAIFPHTDVPTWPASYTCSTYAEETGLSMDGLGTKYRFSHNWNTGSSPVFETEDAIGVVSQDGTILGFGTDAMNTRGDSNGAATCVKPLRAMYQPAANKAITYLDMLMVLSTLNLYQAVGCPGSGGTTTCMESGTLPNWNTVCPNVGDYCTSDKTATGTILDNNVLWLNLGLNSCRGDVVAVDLLSAHPAP
jgi:hypothetical protein